MAFIAFYIMQIMNGFVLCLSESICSISSFSNSKTCSSVSIPHSNQDTDRLLSSLFCCHIENVSYLENPGIKVFICFSIGSWVWGANTDTSPCVSTPTALSFNFYLSLPVPLFSLLGHVGLHLLLLLFAPLANVLDHSTSHQRNIQTRPQETRTPFTDDLTPVQILPSLLLCSFASAFSCSSASLC